MALLLVLISGGCARYEFDVLEPADQRQHVGRKHDAVVSIDPLEYRLRSAEGRLVLWIKNPTASSIRLDGARSVVVDPEGESHPLRSQTIAAQSFIKLIIPPPRPRVGRPGPTIGVGVGVGVGRYDDDPRRHPIHTHDAFYDEPVYLTVYDDADAYYWDFEGEGKVRLELFYHRGGDDTFTHRLVLARRKVD